MDHRDADLPAALDDLLRRITERPDAATPEGQLFAFLDTLFVTLVPAYSAAATGELAREDADALARRIKRDVSDVVRTVAHSGGDGEIHLTSAVKREIVARVYDLGAAVLRGEAPGDK